MSIAKKITLEEFENYFEHHQIPSRKFVAGYKAIYAWVLTEAKFLEKPRSFDHPRGAVTWVRLPERYSINAVYENKSEISQNTMIPQTTQEHNNNLKQQYCSCNMCEYKCKTRGHLKEHLANKHNIDVQWFYCNMCEYKCKHRSGLERHFACVHDIDVNWYSCDMCKFKCKTRSNLKEHLANKHNINVKWFSCDKCDSKFKTRAQLNRHQKTHITDIKSSPQSARSQALHACDICNKTFTFARNLLRHLHETHRICIQEHIKRNKCYYCNRKFKRHSEMTRHCAQVHKKKEPSNLRTIKN